MTKTTNKQIARLNYLRIAPRKVRVVADLIKDLPVNEAEAQLLMIRRRPAKPLLKLLRSAVSSAKTNKKLEEGELFVESLRVDGGPMLKRFLPRARGRATPIQKKMSHVTIVLGQKTKSEKPRFKIVVPKKSKLPPEARPKREKHHEEEKETPKPKRPGFFKKLFSGKSRAAK